MKKTIQERFMVYHESNPHVYQYLCDLARQAKARGFRHYGIASCWERLRWQYDIDTVTNEQFKMSDNFKSRYARYIMEHNEDLQGFFRTKNLRTE